MGAKVIRQVIKEVPWGLTKAIVRLLKFQDQITVILETHRLVHIDVFIRPERGMANAAVISAWAEKRFMRVANTIIDRTVVR